MEAKYPQKMVLLARGMVFLLMAAIVTAAVTLPLWLKQFLLYKNMFDTPRYVLMMILLWISALFAFLILWQGNGFLSSIRRREPFIMENVRRLRRISIYSLAIVAAFFLAIFVYLSIFMCVFIGTFSMVAVIAWIVSVLFAQAVAYKQENELTI